MISYPTTDPWEFPGFCLPIHEGLVDFYGKLVSKYTVRPMNPMGYASRSAKKKDTRVRFTRSSRHSWLISRP